MKLYLIIITLVGLLFCCSCSRTDNDAPHEEGNSLMGFTSEVKQTRGTSSTTENIREMSVFCFHTASSKWESVKLTATPNRMNNLLVRSTGGNLWVYDPPIKWGGSAYDNFTFFGYAPYESGLYHASDNPNGNNVTNNKNVIGVPTLTYQTMTEVESQVDLLIATPNYNHHATNQKVKMNYQHALSKISFAIYAEVPNTAIVSITIAGVKHKGNRNLDPTSPWNIDNETVDFRLDLNNLFVTTDPTKPTDVCAGGGYFMLLPQTLTPLSTLSIKYLLYGETEPREVKHTFSASDTWQMGNAYTYKAHFTGEATAQLIIDKVTIDPWTVDGVINVETPSN